MKKEEEQSTQCPQDLAAAGTPHENGGGQDWEKNHMNTMEYKRRALLSQGVTWMIGDNCTCASIGV